MSNEFSTYKHVSVLTDEVVQYLHLVPDGIYVDATFGGGGHTRAILAANPTVRVVAFDWDTDALAHNVEKVEEEFPGRVMPVWGNFAHLDRRLKTVGITHVNGIIADFGTSQHQIHTKEGFSFAQDTVLDMRMSKAHQQITAADILNKFSEKDLADLFWTYAHESRSRLFARAIVQARETKRFVTTGDLVAVVERCVGKRQARSTHPATKLFQALRIEVNQELVNIKAFLAAAVRILLPEGRLVCISFHSLEDELVKTFFKQQKIDHPDVIEIVTPRVVTASPAELARNRSARSARLRALAVHESIASNV